VLYRLKPATASDETEQNMQAKTERSLDLITFFQETNGASLMEYALLASLASVVSLIVLLACFKGS
jgi:hypothetical protein